MFMLNLGFAGLQAVIGASYACDSAVLATLADASDDLPVGEYVVDHGVAHQVSRNLALVGAQIVLHSPVPIERWTAVLERAENQDEWMPASMGVRQVERFGPANNLLYSRIETSVFGISFMRQVVSVLEEHVEADGRRGRCWTFADPTAWNSVIKSWTTDAPFITVGLGQWEVRPCPDGTVRVTYQVWLQSGIVPASIQGWAIQRTLPDLLRAFEARARVAP